MKIESASASKLKSNKSCEFKYFLEYELMLPQLKGDNIYSSKGTAVHLALECWVNAKLGKTENAEEDYEKTLREYYAEKEIWALDNRNPEKGHTHPVNKTCESCPWMTKDSMCQIAGIPASSFTGCPRPNFEEDLALVKKSLSRTDYNPFALDSNGKLIKKILGVELEFKMELGGVPVKGFQDLIIEEDEETLEVIDYKTGRAMTYDKAVNDPQVRIYGAVARKLFPKYKYVLVTLHYLKTKQVTVALSEEDDALTLKALKKSYNEILTNKDPRRTKSWLCDYCVGYEYCGTIRDMFKVNGRFKLPVINCKFHNQDGQCWGSIYPVGGQEATRPDKIIYACSGHAQINKGGEYVKKEAAVCADKVSGPDADLL